MRRAQDQSGGTGSNNFQAGRDIVLNVGVTATEAREIALDVFRANFLTMTGLAEETVRERVERITNEFLERLEKRNPTGLDSVSDPDMLLAIYNAQKGYACSGEEDLESALVDLLVERSGQTGRGLKTLVLNQALECLPKLTIGQRKAIAIGFLVRYTRHVGPMSLPLMYQHVSQNFGPFADISSNSIADYRYVHSTGAGTVSQFTVDLAGVFWEQYGGVFTKGFRLYHIPEQAREYADDRSVIIPCLRNPQLLQINSLSHQAVRDLQASKGIHPAPGHAGPFETACLYGRMSNDEIEQDLVSHIPFMGQLFEHWNNSGLANFDLTGIGIAIGHAYWRRVTGATTPLDTWL